jgi:hypothetical protein
MPEQHITCPKCGNKIPLTEAFTHDIEEKLRTEFQQDIRKKDAERAAALDAQQKTFEAQRAQDRARVEQQAKRQAEESLGLELKDMKDRLAENSKQLEAARRQELELRKRQRELEEREQNLKLEVERTLATERTKIWEDAGRKAAEEQHLKMAEKEKLVTDMRRQIEELQRRAELTSQQAQGEVLEVELEALLARQFRTDVIEPVAKGVRGADLIQRVHDETGRDCGSIIWESKRTKAWSDGWIQKLKDDQRAAKAEVAVVVSTALPKELSRFGLFEGIWVADFPSAVGLATALRATLIQVARAGLALEGKNEKMELLYRYLSGTGFKQHVEAIVESFVSMKNDLDAEKRAMEKIWSKREAQIDRVVKNTAGLYGDLQGIIGSALPEVKILELPSNDGNG